MTVARVYATVFCATSATECSHIPLNFRPAPWRFPTRGKGTTCCHALLRAAQLPMSVVRGCKHAYALHRGCSASKTRPAVHFQGVNKPSCTSSACYGSRRNSIAAPERQQQPFLVVDVDAVFDVTELVVHHAWHAAQQLWPDKIAGSPQLFHRHLSAVLPALQQPHEAVVAVRLFIEEGVIGARSTAGRAGPVVGHSIRTSSSRPLLPSEIREDWPTIMTTCLIKWARHEQAQLQPQLLLQDIQRTFDEVLSTSAAQEVLLQGEQRGQAAYQPAATLGKNGIPSCTTQSSSSSSGGNSRGSSSNNGSSSSGSSTVPDAAQLPMDCPVLRPYTAASQAVMRSSPACWLVSGHPASLSRVLLPSVEELGMADHFLQWDQLLDLLPAGMQGPVHEAGSSGQAVHVVTSTPARLLQWRNDIATQQRANNWTAADDAPAGQNDHHHHHQQHLQQQQQQGSIAWHVADWTCTQAAVQAQVLASGKADLLSEAAFAELLGLGDVDVIMDGVAWR